MTTDDDNTETTPRQPTPAWSISESLAGRELLVTGTTGFLGKVFASMLLRHHPDLEHVHFLIRSRSDRSAEQRFRELIADSPVLDPVREIYGEAFEEFLDEKTSVVDGDITAEHLGLEADEARALSERLDLLVNCAGLTNFNPNLENALEINTLSQRKFLEFIRLADRQASYLHVSTCFVAGNRDGRIPEQLPGPTRYPRYEELGAELDAEREIEDCLAMVEHAKQLADDQERQSRFRRAAEARLDDKNIPPGDDEAFREAYEYARDKWLRNRLSDEGLERAEHWGWPNIYTYTKSLGERILAGVDDVDVCICRPAIIESSVEYPQPGWIEGVNTSGPLSYLIYRGHRFIPTRENLFMDIVPVDYVSRSLIGITAALAAGRHDPVYQIGSSDLNPVDTERLTELTQLASRRLADRDEGMSGLQKLIVKNADSVPVHPTTFENISAPRVRQTTEGLKGLLDRVPTSQMGGLGEAVEAVQGAVDSAHRAALTTEKFFEVFFPFIAENRYIFRSRRYDDLLEGLSAAERERYRPRIRDLDWREYWMNIHVPALAELIFPQIDARLSRSRKEVYTYEDLVDLFEASTEHFEDRVAMQHHHGGVVERYTYGEMREYAERAAGLLEAEGVRDDVPVLLASENRPQWGMAYFGILEAGGIAVPVDPDSSAGEFVNFVRSSQARAILVSSDVNARVGDELRERLEREGLPATLLTFDRLFTPALEASAADGGEVVDLADRRTGDPEDWEPNDALVEQSRRGGELASLIYTSGTTGEPKGVMLTHENFTSLLSNMKSVFEIDPSDEFVSVLPLHHTFEFGAGFLMPLSEGATVTYLEELDGEELIEATTSNRATAMVGVPALWELLYRKIRRRVTETHPAVEWVVDKLQKLNRQLRDRAGVNLGPVAFSAVHRALGGNLEYLVSGGAALPEEVLEGFYGLGFDLYEGYGLTEAAPVLTVNRPDGEIAPGTVGEALPEVEVDLHDPDADGVGEVIARGPNVMAGYLDREEADEETLRDGWLFTGDVGRFDEKGNLEIVGRKKEVIVTPGGENVYPDELEEMYGGHERIDELSVVGLPDGSGSERVACLVRPALPEEASEEEAGAVREELREWFRTEASRTASHKQIRVLRFWDEEFPRTATRKIRRTEVVEILEEMLDEEKSEARARADGAESGDWQWLDAIVARVADCSPAEIDAATHLIDDLGFDSLMAVELANTVRERRGVELTPEDLSDVQTNTDLRELIERRGDGGGGETTALVETDAGGGGAVETWDPPPFVRRYGKEALHRAQMGAYDKLYDVEVYGRANIPHHDPNVLVAANHCSHLDMGLVKYALGEFGRGIRALAAADYFFDDPLRQTYFSNFTNLIPVERSGSLEQALSEANRAIERGETVLIFPEGTRSTDGTIQEFQDGLGYLVDRHAIDVLPMYLDGTYQAFPKGQTLPSPLKRNLKVHIGEVLDARRAREATADLGDRERFAAISDETRDRITTLRDRAAGVEGEDDPVEPLFSQLSDEFDAENANGSEVSYYFTLGDVSDLKWSVIVDGDRVKIRRGKPDGGQADCVVKTSPAMFERIVREGYVPSVDEFVSGDIKTNDPELLRDFQEFFGLN